MFSITEIMLVDCSKIKPLGTKVLFKQTAYKEGLEGKSGIIDKVEEKYFFPEDRGEIVAIGEQVTKVKIGDFCILSPHAGKPIPVTRKGKFDKQYLEEGDCAYSLIDEGQIAAVVDLQDNLNRE